MLIVSWNVAGLSTTANRIYSAYGGGGGSKGSKGSPSVVLSEYFQRHGADIVCIQEHKIPLSQLSNRCEPLGCSNIDGYESFWSCCTDQNKKGLNGVVTYVKKGLIIKANSRPLGSKDLDDQGRCVMTDHGHFVLFNVYVPAGGGQPLSYKMKFLNALRQAMQQQRRKYNKPVMVCGDLNISHTQIDNFWADSCIRVNDIRRQVASSSSGDASSSSSSSPPLPWMIQLAEAWPKIEKSLQTKQVVPTQTTNPRTNEKFDKFRLKVEMAVEKKSEQKSSSQTTITAAATAAATTTVYLGSHESSPEHCEHYYDFKRSWSYSCPDTDDEIFVREEDNIIPIGIIGELMSKIARINWDESTLRQISKDAGYVSPKFPPRRWLNTILNEDQMVDAFRYYNPNSIGRFTCWHQFTNKRYTNEGSRIDFTLVDKTLLPFVRQGQSTTTTPSSSSSSSDCEAATTTNTGRRISFLRGGGNNENGTSSNAMYDVDSEAAALCAVTANGKFQPVSFEGGGIIEVSKDVLDTQFCVPHTGMIYTPPSFSDHIAISLLINDQLFGSTSGAATTSNASVTSKNDSNAASCGSSSTSIGAGRMLTLDITDSATKKSQPHKAQKTIASFFTTKNSSSRITIDGSASKKTTITTLNNNDKKKRQKISNFFSSVKASSLSLGEEENQQKQQASSSSSSTTAKSNGTNAIATGATKSNQPTSKMGSSSKKKASPRPPRPDSIQNYFRRKD